MLRALIEWGITPDLIVGTSIGAVNGAMIAADPSLSTIGRMADLWTTIGQKGVLDSSFIEQIKTFSQSGTHLQSNESLRQLFTDAFTVERFEDLVVPFQCVAASIEAASIHYFEHGPLIEAVLASSAMPGLLPAVEIDGQHYFDGGLVAPIPLDRAIELGATTIYVLQVGWIEAPLAVPTNPWDVAMVAYEIARRHRFLEALASVPPEVKVHVLPTGEPKAFNNLKNRVANSQAVAERIEESYKATYAYLNNIETLTAASARVG
jgi:NTE family protein